LWGDFGPGGRDASGHKLLPRLLNPLLKGMFRKGMAKHAERLAAYCERRAKAAS